MQQVASCNIKCSDHQLMVILCVSLPLCCGERKGQPQSWTEMLWQCWQHLLCVLLHLFDVVQLLVVMGDACPVGQEPLLWKPHQRNGQAPMSWPMHHGWGMGKAQVEEQHLGVVSWDLEITVSSPQDQSARSPSSQQTWCTQSPHRAPASKGFLKLW